jgi:phosphopantothenoylcysteine decarboxylase/phosphopantothenate--cysteine ligase
MGAEKPTVALVVSGSIAAYKAPMVARLLLAAGWRVLPVMTASAERFVGSVTLSGLTGEPVRTSMWDPTFAGEMHVELARQADVIAYVPATADLLARLAQGRADDLAAALGLVARGPRVVAPAMHPQMWHREATQRNVARLVADGVSFVGPVYGPVASGEEGLGRMAEPEAIVKAIVAALRPRDLAGRHIVVTAGPTVEDLDPVRFLGNRSTGKMGFAIAESAAKRGAKVTLIAGPTQLVTPSSVQRVDVRSTAELAAAMELVLGEALEGADALVMTAAVADYRPAQASTSKEKKGKDRIALELVKNPDLLATVGAKRNGGARPVLVGFAVESAGEHLLPYSRRKLIDKRVDLVVANPAETAFGGDANEAWLVDGSGDVALGTMSKRGLAERILDEVVKRLAASAT